MKKVLCFLSLLLICITASAMSPTDVGVGLTHLADNAATYAVGAAVVVGSITPEMINDAKVKFGKGVQVLTVVVVDEVKDASGAILTPVEQYQFIVRRPDRSLIKLLTTAATDNDIDKFFDIASKNLIIGGDTDFLDDGLVYQGFVEQVKQLISPAHSFLSPA
jgi:hypothetical protein